MALLRRRIFCHYCNNHLRDFNNVTPIPETMLCSACDALNHFDENGNTVDPPAQITSQLRSFQNYISRSPSPSMPPSISEQHFCDECQRNHTLLMNLLAEYYPDEGDPEYAEYEAAFPDYKAELEDRYPQVCQNCLPGVQDRIRNVGYAAKADHLRRIMEKSEQKRKTVPTSRQLLIWRLIPLGRGMYVVSTLVGLLWHASALLMAVDEQIFAQDSFDWSVCSQQALITRSVDQNCVLSPDVSTILNWAFFADFMTLWWNPKLKEKTDSLTGRMDGLKTLWVIRAIVLVLRVASLHYWKMVDVDYDNLARFRQVQMGMLVVLAISLLSTWKIVRVNYIAPSVLRRRQSENLPSAPNSAQKPARSEYRPAHPQSNTFDHMAQAFTSSFQDQDSAALPPSPTLTASSYTTFTTDATTPFAERRTFLNDDDMDWTPTRRRFGQQEPEVIPNQWAQRSAREASPLQQRAQEPHSLFAKEDPNPFRHKVPAAPKAPAQKVANPWQPGVWNQPLKETVPKFFKDEQKMNGGVGESKGLEGFGVPKNVQRDSEMFASPQLKYDYYGTPKDTGLEDTFNGLFSK